MAENPSNQHLSDKFWTIPNILSIARVFMIIPIVDQLRTNTPESNFAAFLWISAAYFTDFLDGFLARMLKSISKVGQILDPIGDKLLAITVSAVLYITKQAPIYFFILIFLRDLIISLGAIYAMNTKKMIMLPLLTGKVTTFVLGIVLAIYPLGGSFLMKFNPWNGIIKAIITYGTYLASLLLVFSGVVYSVNYFRNFMTQRKNTRK